MQQQKKFHFIYYIVLGLLIVTFLLSLAELSTYTVNFKSISLADDSLCIVILSVTSSAIALWFIYQLVREIKVRRQADCALYLSEAAVRGSINGVTITDSDARVIFVNPAFEAITGYSAKEVNGNNLRMLSSGHHTPAFYQNMWSKLELEGKWSGEIWNRRKNGEVYLQWMDIVKFPQSMFNTGRYLGIFSDITDRKFEEGEQAFQATHDPLTLLPNRNLFFDRVENEFRLCSRNNSKLVMFFLDLDAFKPINDTYGHIVGDQVLIEVSKRITHCIRQTDTTCRYGGDEFIVLLPGIHSEQDWMRIANELLSSISQPYVVDGHQLNLSVSIGVAIYQHGDELLTVSEFIRKADEAMYAAKTAGKNSYHLAG